jgi:hypothetical protein
MLTSERPRSGSVRGDGLERLGVGRGGLVAPCEPPEEAASFRNTTPQRGQESAAAPTSDAECSSKRKPHLGHSTAPVFLPKDDDETERAPFRALGS